MNAFAAGDPLFRAARGWWPGQRLLRLSRIIRRKEVRGREDEELLSVYRTLGVVPRRGRTDNWNKPGEDLSKYKYVKRGNLVVNKMKAWQGSLGVSNHEGLVSPAYFVCSVSPTFHGRYLHHVLRSAPYVSEFRRLSKGIRPNQWDLDFEMLGRVPIVALPLERQRQLAALIDKMTERIDALVAFKEALLTLTMERWRALLTQAVTRGEPPEPALVDSGIQAIGPVPEGWKVVRLCRTVQITDCKHKTCSYVEGGVALVNTPEVKPGRLSFEGCRRTTREEYLQLIGGGRKPTRGDIIYSRNASLGAAAYVDTEEEFAMGQDVCLLRPLKNSGLYIHYVLNSVPVVSQVERMVVGATFGRINVDQIRSLWVTCPPRPVQDRIASYLDQVDSVHVDLSSKLTASIALLQERRQALVTAAVTGQLKSLDQALSVGALA